ncbi:MAG: CHRD domain-containing protein [Gemmatimonadales bacterium]
MHAPRGLATGTTTLALVALLAAAAAPPPVAEVFLQAEMTGTTEVPGPGDRDGRGTIRLRVLADSGKVCYEATITGIARPRQVHVHQGEVGSAGPPVVTLTSDLAANPSGCVMTEPAVLAEVVEQPGRFYLNVHSAEHPAGAIRGQLALALGEPRQ